MHKSRLRGHTRLVSGNRPDGTPRDPHVRVTLCPPQLWARADIEQGGGSATATTAEPLNPSVSGDVDTFEVWAASTSELDLIECTFCLGSDQDFDYLLRLITEARKGFLATKKLAPSALAVVEGGVE